MLFLPMIQSVADIGQEREWLLADTHKDHANELWDIERLKQDSQMEFHASLWRVEESYQRQIQELEPESKGQSE